MYKKHIFLAIFYCLSTSILLGHSSEVLVDSVKNLLKASYNLSMNNPDSSTSVVEIAIKLSKELKNDTLLADSYTEMAYIHNDLGQTKESINYTYMALELYEKTNNYAGISKAYMQIVWQELKADEFENVFDFLDRALESVKKTDDSVTLSSVYHLYGAAYNWTYGNWMNKKKRVVTNDSFYIWVNRAIEYDKKAIAIRRKLNVRGLHSTLNNLGMALKKKAYYTNQDYSEAEKAYAESLSIRKKNNDLKGLAGSYLQLANFAIMRSDYEEAEKYLFEGISYADSLQYTLHQQMLYNRISELKEMKLEYDSALFYFKKATFFNNKKNSSEYKIEIKNLETKYGVAEKEKEILIANQKLRSQKLILFLAGIIFIILFSTAFIYFKLYHKNKKLSEKNYLLVKEQNHRVKNNLQIISALLNLQANRVEHTDAKQAIEDSKLRVEAIGMIQKRLYGENTVEVNVNEFVKELVDSIISLYDYEQSQIKINLDIDTVWMRVEKTVPLGLILNELLTNSCKYAFDNNPTPELNISLREENNQIFFSYHDNGGGFNPEEVNKQKSFGIKLIDLQSYQLNAQPVWEKNGGMEFRIVFD